MSSLLPVNLSLHDLISRVLGVNKGAAPAQPVVDLSSYTDLLAAIQDGKITLPKTLPELNREDTFVHQLAVKAAVDLGIPLGSFTVDAKTSVFVQDYAKYREIVWGQTVALIGTTVRYSIVFRSLDTSIKLSSLPAISAAVQLGYAEAGATFEVRGVSSRSISQAVPIVSTMDVDAYARFSEALNKIKDLMWEPATAVDFVPIAIGHR